MSADLRAGAPATLARAVEIRAELGTRFFDAEAERIARLCHRVAERFARGGRLLALGGSPAARSDARHVAVEFVHPVIVGKRALPAIALGPEGGPLRDQLRLLARADDLVLAFATEEGDPDVLAALALARERDCLTVAFAPAGAEWELVPPGDDPLVRQELVETLYHIVWELCHVFFEHRGLLEGRTAKPVHDAGASSFLYPFLAERETDLDAVLADVTASVRMKAAEIAALRRDTLLDPALVPAAGALAGAGTVLALGNGGSATDAMDLVADLRRPPHGWRPRRALDLTEDPAILTAIANDVGVEAVFARQVAAHGAPGDVVVALSTSGGSANVIAALAAARRAGLATVALVGYDGGRILAEGLADHVVVTRSEHIPRIQEAQASAYHVMRALMEDGDDG